MSPHPDAKIIDGAAVDAAEAREDKTPTATPTPRSGGAVPATTTRPLNR
jgi:hypothetical protein